MPTKRPAPKPHRSPDLTMRDVPEALRDKLEELKERARESTRAPVALSAVALALLQRAAFDPALPPYPFEAPKPAEGS